MIYLWFTMIKHDLPMIYLWFTYDLPWLNMIYLWFTYDLPMIYLWFTYDFPMIYLWFTYDFPMIKHDLSWLTNDNSEDFTHFGVVAKDLMKQHGNFDQLLMGYVIWVFFFATNMSGMQLRQGIKHTDSGRFSWIIGHDEMNILRGKILDSPIARQPLNW